MTARAGKRKIAVVTGTRSEYGLLRSTMREISRTPALRLQVIAAGMHLAPQFGGTVSEIAKDGFRVDARIAMTPANDSDAAMANSVGLGILGMVKALRRLQPDVVLVLGDRVEALAAAVAAAYMNIPLAHIHGGDSAKAGLDESARHAITKFAHLHFAATRKSAERIRRLGEPPDRIHLVGAPGLDEILHGTRTPRAEVCRKYHLDPHARLALLIQHPVTTEPEQGARQIRESLAALAGMHLPTLVVYPNADAGGRRMIQVIKSYEKRHSLLRAYPSVPRQDFLGLMAVASVMVGNSSGGIVEAASFGLPVVNVGSRQEGRERAGNVIDVGYTRAAIAKAVAKAVSRSFAERARRTRNPYGDGRAALRITRVLCRLRSGDAAFLQKNITY